MTFAQLVAGSSVFLDANTLVYFFQPHPTHGPACQQLMQRVVQGQLQGFTSTHVLAEVAHRLMTMEAMASQGWTPSKVGQRLRRHHAVLQSLAHFETAVNSVLQSPIQVLAIPSTIMSTAVALSRQFGLLINDALLVAVMQANGLTNLASNDADFDRVPSLVRYGPV